MSLEALIKESVLWLQFFASKPEYMAALDAYQQACLKDLLVRVEQAIGKKDDRIG